jgi:hypothetical protein
MSGDSPYPNGSWDPGSGEPVPPAQPGAYPPPGGYPPPGTPPPGYPTAPAGAGYPPPGAPPPGYQQPSPARPGGYDAAGAAPKKKRKVWRWLLGIFVVLLLLIGGCTYLVIDAVRGPVDRVNAFMAAVDEGDLATAASLMSTSSECFGEQTTAIVESTFGSVDVTDYNFVTSNVQSSNGTSSGQVSGTLTTTADGEVPATFVLTKENDEWVLCGWDIG